METSVATMPSQGSPEKKKGFFSGVRPAARDGHSADVFGKYLIIFGGDRHHMPFNDLHFLDIEAEVQAKQYLFK